MNSLHFSTGKNLSVQRPAVTTIAAGLSVSAAILLSGCGSHSHDDAHEYPSAIEKLAVRRAQPDPLVESQTRGRDVYQHYCQVCHGAEAQGNGFNAAMLDPPPRNFADNAFWEQASDEHLTAVIARGGKAVGKSVLMPPWGRTLDEQQIRDVIAYLRTVPELVKRAAAAEPAAASD